MAKMFVNPTSEEIVNYLNGDMKKLTIKQRLMLNLVDNFVKYVKPDPLYACSVAVIGYEPTIENLDSMRIIIRPRETEWRADQSANIEFRLEDASNRSNEIRFSAECTFFVVRKISNRSWNNYNGRYDNEYDTNGISKRYFDNWGARKTGYGANTRKWDNAYDLLAYFHKVMEYFHKHADPVLAENDTFIKNYNKLLRQKEMVGDDVYAAADYLNQRFGSKLNNNEFVVETCDKATGQSWNVRLNPKNDQAGKRPLASPMLFAKESNCYTVPKLNITVRHATEGAWTVIMNNVKYLQSCFNIENESASADDLMELFENFVAKVMNIDIEMYYGMQNLIEKLS